MADTSSVLKNLELTLDDLARLLEDVARGPGAHSPATLRKAVERARLAAGTARVWRAELEQQQRGKRE